MGMFALCLILEVGEISRTHLVITGLSETKADLMARQGLQMSYTPKNERITIITHLCTLVLP